MTGAQAVQWAILLALVALFFVALGGLIAGRVVPVIATVAAGVAVVFYAIALAT